MGELRSSQRRAFHDTWRIFGGWPAVVFITCIPPVGFALHWFVGAEVAAVRGEIAIWAIYGLAAAAIIFFAFYLWNLASAPYRNERDRRKNLEEQLLIMSNTISSFKESLSYQEKLRAMAERLQRFGIDYSSTKPGAKDDLNFGISDETKAATSKVTGSFQGNVATDENTNLHDLRMITMKKDERAAYDNKWWEDFKSQFGGELQVVIEEAQRRRIISYGEANILFELEIEHYRYRMPECFSGIATLLRTIAAREDAESQRRIS